MCLTEYNETETMEMMRQEGLREGRINGKAAGVIELALDLGCSDEYILSTLQKKLDVNVEQAEDYLKRYYEGTL